VFKNLRILFLLLILVPLVYALRLPADPAPDWDQPQRVTIYPVSADASPSVERFIEGLTRTDFDALGTYFRRQAQRHGLSANPPFRFSLGEELEAAPPIPDDNLSGLARLRWGITLRWWHWRLSRRYAGTDIVVVARFQQPVDGPIDLHSIGMASPRLALVSLVADPSMQGLNEVKIAHELLHTVGASDFYDRYTREPLWPEGYADAERRPRFPQPAAELMAGRIPVSARRSRQPGALDATVIGIGTAREIGWIDRLIAD